MRRSMILAALFLAVTAFSATATPPLDLLDHWWSSASAPPGFNGEVRALLSYEGNLYVGGTFQGADAAAMNHVGRWDGTEWSGLGEGLNHVVFCLAGYQGDVVAGGMFSVSGADSISHLARWDGTGWQPFGSGFQTPVTAAVEHEGELYVASYGRCVAREGRPGFGDCVEWDSEFLARWNDSGQAWTPLATEEARGDLQFLGRARDLAVFDGQVVAAMPVRVPGSPHDMLYPAAILVDDRWEPFGPGVADIVGVKRPFAKCILADEDQIFLAGLFPSVENEIGNPARLVKGGGTDWTALDPGFSGGIYALAGDGDRLVVAGELQLQRWRGELATGVSVWNGETWTGLTPSSRDQVWALAEHEGALYAGGSFLELGGEPVWNLARHDGAGWEPATEQSHTAIQGPVYALASLGGTVVARNDSWGESFAFWALRDGVWRGLTEDPQTAPAIDPMTTLCLSKYNGASAEVRYPVLEHESQLYTYGWKSGLMTWDEKSGWQFISPVLSWSENNQYWYDVELSALGVWHGRLVAGGRFERIGEVEARGIAVRDGESWMALGAGLDFSCPPGDDDCFSYYIQSGHFCRVRAMAELDGDLIVAGSFNRAGGKKCLNIARWDGAQWHSLGAGLNDVIMDLAVVGDDLYAAGYFAGAGPDEDIDYIARWDGSRWQALDRGLDAPAFCLEVYNDHLYVGGLFRQAGFVSARHLAAWDGFGWQAVGSGVNGAVNDLLVHEGSLYAGGEFTEAGGVAAFHAAKWTEPVGGAEVTGLVATRTEAGIELRWSLTGITFRFAGFHVDREHFRGGMERLTPEPLSGTGDYVFTDTLPLKGEMNYTVSAVTRSGEETPVATFRVEPVTAIPLALHQNHPNPFRGGPAGEITKIRFSVPEPGPVRIRVIDITGREVALLLDAHLPTGEYEMPWTGLDGQGRPVASGVYFYRLESEQGGLVRKVVVLD